MGTPGAIERCAYCRRYVPVTYVEVTPTSGREVANASVAVCAECFEDGR